MPLEGESSNKAIENGQVPGSGFNDSVLLLRLLFANIDSTAQLKEWQEFRFKEFFL